MNPFRPFRTLPQVNRNPDCVKSQTQRKIHEKNQSRSRSKTTVILPLRITVARDSRMKPLPLPDITDRQRIPDGGSEQQVGTLFRIQIPENHPAAGDGQQQNRNRPGPKPGNNSAGKTTHFRTEAKAPRITGVLDFKFSRPGQITRTASS